MNTPYSEIKTSSLIKNLRDVNITNPNDDNQLLTYNGTNWVSSYDVKMKTDEDNLKIENSTYKGVRIGKIEENIDSNTCVSIGTYSLSSNYGIRNVSIGYGSAENGKGAYSVSVGYLASSDGTGISTNTLSIGREAGIFNQGLASIAIGAFAGYCNQHDNSVIINATGEVLNSDGTSRFYVKPVRQVNKGHGKANGLYYNSTTGEITYSGN